MNTRNSNSNLFFICLFCLIIGVILFLIYGEYTAKKKKQLSIILQYLEKKKRITKKLLCASITLSVKGSLLYQIQLKRAKTKSKLYS